MKITVFNGSPRGERGNTHRIVKEFLAGAKEAGAEVENVELHKQSIHHCTGCMNCWIVTPGECVHKDGMAGLLEKYEQSDVAVFASPLYCDHVTGIFKNFIDRFLPLIDPYFALDEHGEMMHVQKLEDVPKMIAISNCGYLEQTHFQVLRPWFRRIARNLHAELIGEIYRGGGGLLGMDDPKLDKFITAYNELVRKAGREVVEDGRISEKTAEELEKPLMPISINEYVLGGNANWDRLLREKRKRDG